MDYSSKFLKLKSDYRKIIEASMIVALLVLVILFQAFKRFDIKMEIPPEKIYDKPFDFTHVPQTKHRSKPKPQRPTVPVPFDEPEFPGKLPVEELEEFTGELPSAPILNLTTLPDFISYQSEPELIGGISSIQKNIIYPKAALAFGIEGEVFIKCLIDKKGKVAEIVVEQSLIDSIDEAVIEAVKLSKWKPAMQRDKPAEVWVEMSFVFNIKPRR